MLFCGSSDEAKVAIISEKRAENSKIVMAETLFSPSL